MDQGSGADSAGETVAQRPRRRPRRRASVAGVLGELLITAGVLTLLFVTWQLWIGDAIISSQKTAEAAALSESWAESGPTNPPTAAPTPEVADPEATAPAAVPAPVLAQPAHGEVFGVMHVPRFGPAWTFKLAGGVTRPDILDAGEIGHYPDSAMPGEVGNMAVAAHRWTSGAPFDPIDQLVVGDAVVIETADGWYTYRFRNLEYVQASQVDVLLPVPQRADLSADGQYLTLTSCAPKFNMLERIIAYTLFESFTPRDAGAPASLTEAGAA